MKYVLVISIHADPAMAPGYEEWGGTHVYMKELIDGLAAKKIKCVMFTRKSFALQDVEQYNEYCTVVRLHNGDAKPIDKTLLWRYHEYNLAQIQAYISEHGKPEVIHSVYWNSGRLAMELGEKNNIPFVHSVISNSIGRVSRGAIEPLPKRAGYERQIYEKAKWIICVSDDERNDIERFYNISPNKMVVAGQHIHEAFLLPSRDVNGFPRLSSGLCAQEREAISENFNTAYTIQTDEQYWSHKSFTYMGRVGFNKGLEQIIKAWHRLFQRFGRLCPPLWIIGGSIAEIHSVREVIKKDIPEIDLLENDRLILWWGYLDAVGLSTVLLKTLALIMHSYYEPGGRVIVEAMAEGIPVIATPYGFGKDYVVDWRNGFVVDYDDINGLYLRMAHFLHQPYLSNALGQNARRDARTIIRSWNFIDNHLMAYGLQFAQPSALEVALDGYDYFKTRKINMFPYYNISLSKDYIEKFISRVTKCTVIECTKEVGTDATSDIYRIKTSSDTIIVKQAFTRLRISPMFNPFDKGRLVQKAEKSFGVELSAYIKTSSKVYLGHDDMHYLLALNELSPINEIDVPQLRRCIDYIVNKVDISTAEEKAIFCQITKREPCNESNIMTIYNELEQKLPSYYFERSGRFSEIIGWASAPFILAFNQDSFPHTILEELRAICAFFSKNVHPANVKKIRSINTDIKLRHFMLNIEQLEMFDLEQSSMGCIESELADLLYDYWRMTDSNFTLSKILRFLPEECDICKVISHMAYICFYDIQIAAVMQRSVSTSKMRQLQMLCVETIKLQ